MKSRLIFCVSALCILTMLTASTLSGCGVDPNVKQEEEASTEYKVDIGGDEEEAEGEGFHAYGKGKTDSIELDGVEVSVQDFAVRSYELAYMLAQGNFEKPEEIALDAAVQYAFAHIYFEDLYTIENKAVRYRSATEEQIREKLRELFGTDDFDVTASVLYQPSKQSFEMWMPAYGTNIYYNIDAVNIDGSKAEIITTYYNEFKRSTLFGRTTMTVAVKDGKPVIQSLKTE
ncbi:MAG: hypothetical protein IJV48_07745 [Ruminococcus sp.]|nr:hypothetical protein [Ruminococcus sp.]